MRSISVLLRLLLCVALQAMYAAAQSALFNNSGELSSAILSYIDDEDEAIRTYGVMNDWDTSNVKYFQNLFSALDTLPNDLNYLISDWDTSSVVEMTQMFAHQIEYNQPLDSWDTSGCYIMDSVFYEASKFNQYLGSWDTSRVGNMWGLFQKSYDYNQEMDSWDVSQVMSMYSMFDEASSFNARIGSWDTSRLVDMHSTFSEASAFDQILSSWDTSRVTDFHSAFYSATAFHGDLGFWDTSSATDMTQMFDGQFMVQGFQLECWNVTNVVECRDFGNDLGLNPQDLGLVGYVHTDTGFSSSGYATHYVGDIESCVLENSLATYPCGHLYSSARGHAMGLTMLLTAGASILSYFN